MEEFVEETIRRLHRPLRALPPAHHRRRAQPASLAQMLDSIYEKTHVLIRRIVILPGRAEIGREQHVRDAGGDACAAMPRRPSG